MQISCFGSQITVQQSLQLWEPTAYMFGLHQVRNLLHVSLSHHSCVPVKAAGWELAGGTALEAHWSLTRFEGLVPSLAPQRLPSCQDLAPALSLGLALPV